jgi:hypothetical protein
MPWGLPFWVGAGVWAGVFSARPRDVALVLCPPRSLSRLLYVTPSLTALLGAAHLSAPHRHSHEEDHEHDGDCHHDHDYAGANRKYDNGGAHASPSQWTVAPAYLRDRQVGGVAS